MSEKVVNITITEPMGVDTGESEEEQEDPREKICCQTIRTKGCVGWCIKFLWEGQMHNKVHAEAIKQLELTDDLPLHKRLLITHRRFIGFAVPALIVHFLWWAFIIKWNLFYLFPTRYPMSITMIVGSIVAGMTSEGGGAVAFPVMTLVLNEPASVARDLSLMIQASGMTCATFAILFMRIQVEWSSIIFCSIGGIFGFIFGFHVVDVALSNAQKKMYFVSIWFSFAFALFLLNRNYKRRTFKAIPNMNLWKIVVLLCTGFTGGVCSAFSGNGLDVCSFSVLTLLFRVSEKVATPTSVVLMAFGSIFGFFWRALIMDGGISQDAWEYWACCIPIVTLGAPFGAVLGSHFHRLVLAAWVYASDTVALVGGFALVKQTPILAGVSVGLIATGFAVFLIITYAGRKLLEAIERDMPNLARRNTMPTLGKSASSASSLNKKTLEVPPNKNGKAAASAPVVALDEATLNRLLKLAANGMIAAGSETNTRGETAARKASFEVGGEDASAAVGAGDALLTGGQDTGKN